VTTKPVPLSRPITVGKLTVTALTLDIDFKVGWLRGAPTTPTWFIGVVRSLFANIDFDAAEEADAAAVKVDQEAIDKMLANLPVPSGEEISAMIPWMLHVAEKATGQPPEVIDQLGPVDLVMIVMQLLPGMMALANFQKTSPNGAATSQGSSTGAPQT
jgi:hypothetical protein